MGIAKRLAAFSLSTAAAITMLGYSASTTPTDFINSSTAISASAANYKPSKVTIKSKYSCTSNAIRVNWNPVSGATGYRVYRHNGKRWEKIATVRGTNNNTYRDGKCSAGTTYKYKVKAYKKVNNVNYWGDSSATKYTSTKSAKLSVNATSKNSNTIQLNWGKVNGTGYQIYQLKGSSYVKIATCKNINTTSFDVSNLANNASYKFKVRAYTVDANGKVNPGTCGKASTNLGTVGTTPVEINGQLRISGANIVNANGNPFKIKGMSTHGIMWEDFSNILSKDSLKVLRDDWKVNTIRIAMYTEEWGGYTTGSSYASQAKAKVDTGVKNATDLGMYAIIDWHILQDGNPQTHQTESIAFFAEMAKKYKDYNNVMYEICNEPNGGVTWNGQIKSYCEKVVKEIRKYDKDAIIICGTGTWSQDIHQVIGNKLSDKNCVYSLHFYANTHTDNLRNRFTQCYNSGLPILVSEFGTCDASGNGGFNSYQTKEWLKLLDSKNVGYINWSACGKSETASAFVSGTNLSKIKSGTSQLTESGKLIRDWYRNH